MGIQYRRSSAPIRVPGPTSVSARFASSVSIETTPVGCEPSETGEGEGRSTRPPPYTSSRLELILDRQVPDSLARRREDRVANGGRDRGDPRPAHTAERLVVVPGDDVDADHARRG